MKKALLLGIAFIFLVIPLVQGFGIRPAYGYPQYQYNDTVTGTFNIVNSENKDLALELSVDGKLKDNIMLSDYKIRFSEEEYKIDYTINLQGLGPGEFTAVIFLEETDAEGEGIATKLRLPYKIILKIPYPEKYVEYSIDFEIADDWVTMLLDVNNLGYGDLDSVTALVDFAENDWYIATLETDEKPIESGDSKTLKARISRDKLQNGKYNASVKLYYDNNILQEDLVVILGTPAIGLRIPDIYFKNNSISKFNLEIENLWNEPFKDVYAEIAISDKYYNITSVKTYSVDLAPREKKTIYAYWDTIALPYGDYFAEITIHSGDYNSAMKFKVSVVSEQEYRKILASNSYKTTRNAFIAVVIILLIAIYLFIKKSPNHKKKRG